VAATHSQVEALLFGSVSDPETSDAWIGSTEGLAALKHVSSVLNPQRSALNVLVFQDDTAPLRMRATWPWQSSDDGLPLHGVMITSSGLPGMCKLLIVRWRWPEENDRPCEWPGETSWTWV